LANGSGNFTFEYIIAEGLTLHLLDHALEPALRERDALIGSGVNIKTYSFAGLLPVIENRTI
jgi:hypothetical protein